MTDNPKGKEIETDFVPESFFENIKTDKIRPRKEWIAVSVVFLVLTYLHFILSRPPTIHVIFSYIITLCLAFLLVKAYSFKHDINDTDRFIAREIRDKYSNNYQVVKWAQIGDCFKYLNIALLLLLIAVSFSEHQTRIVVAMIVFIVFSTTRLYKFRNYINQIYALYDAISQSGQPASINTTSYFNIKSNLIKAITVGVIISTGIYLFSLETRFTKLLMYAISFGSIYFMGNALYCSRSNFFKFLIDIDNKRKSVS